MALVAMGAAENQNFQDKIRTSHSPATGSRGTIFKPPFGGFAGGLYIAFKPSPAGKILMGGLGEREGEV